MGEFHRFENIIDDQRRTEPRAQTEKEHPPAAIASERLHRGIVDDLDWTMKGFAKIKSHPAAAKVVRLAHWTAVNDRPGIANRDGVIFPMSGGLADRFGHFFGGHFWTGGDFDRVFVPGGEHLQVSAADVDDENFHGNSRLVLVL